MSFISSESETDLKKDQNSQHEGLEYVDITDYEGASESTSLKREDYRNEVVEIYDKERPRS
jgi:hypothetical protein